MTPRSAAFNARASAAVFETSINVARTGKIGTAFLVRPIPLRRLPMQRGLR
jgi:hypothetical protein